MSAGQFKLALDHHRWIAAALPGDLIYERCGVAVLPAIMSRAHIADTLALLGEFNEATTIGREALRLAEHAGHVDTLANALSAVGAGQLTRGHLSEAMAYLERGLALAEAGQFGGLLPLLIWGLGRSYARAGRVTDALSLLERGMQEARRIGHVVREVQHLTAFSEAYLLADRIGEATRSGQEALGRSRALGMRFTEAQSLLILGDIRAVATPTPCDDAEALYAEALGLTAELGMRPLAAHCHLGLGKLYGRAGKQREAQEHLTTAVTMYREMDMRFWLEKAEAEIKESA